MSANGALANRRLSSRSKREVVPELENGDRLMAGEFMRRYEAMPEDVRAELIEGIVYISPPVRADTHGEPHGLIIGWLGTYLVDYPGLNGYTNASYDADMGNQLQPDVILCSAPKKGGRVWLSPKG